MPAQSTSFSLLTSLLWLTAFVLCLVASARCDFVEFVAETTDDGQVVSRGFGLWWYQYWFLTAVSGGGGTNLYVVESCASYPQSLPLDSAWRAAQAFNVIIVILAIITLVLMCVAACAVDEDNQMILFSPPLFVVMALCQGLNLLILSSKLCDNNPLLALGDLDFPVECGLATGAKCCVAAMCFWLAAAVSSFLEHKALKKAHAHVQGGLDEPFNP